MVINNEKVEFDKEQLESYNKIIKSIESIESLTNKEQTLRVLCKFNEKILQDMIYAKEYGYPEVFLDILVPMVDSLNNSKLESIKKELGDKDNRYDLIVKYKANILEFLYYLDFNKDTIIDYSHEALYKINLNRMYDYMNKNVYCTKKEKTNEKLPKDIKDKAMEEELRKCRMKVERK